MQNREHTHEAAEAYLKALVAEATALPLGDFDPASPFGELGVDSFRVLKIIKALEADFGTLPKTLLFENFNVESLARYFVERHPDALAARVTGALPKPRVVADPSPTPTPIAQKAPNRPAASASRVVADAHAGQVRLLESELPQFPELKAQIDALFARYCNEGGVSRGTRDIAPNLFIGARRLGYFNYARSKALILVYAYTGPREYFAELADELQRYCLQRDFQLNLFADDVIAEIGGVEYSATPFGALQRVLSIRDFSLQGSAMRRLRYQLAKFEKIGVCSHREYRSGSDPQVDQAIATVIDNWCASKPMVNPLIGRVRAEILEGRLHSQHRLFLTYLNDELQNVILISRLCEDLNGYLMDLEFYGQDMPLGGLEYSIVRIIQTLAQEGCDLLSLGGTYGCRLESSPHADPEVDRVLDDLHRQGIFNDEGNLQFKNKFRPENRTIYLSRPRKAGAGDSVLDLIMMIADPERSQTSEHENRCPPASGLVEPARADISSGRIEPAQLSELALPEPQAKRLQSLQAAGFNPLQLQDAAVEFEHKTDSWAQLRHRPEVADATQRLREELQNPIDLQQSLASLFPFRHIALTESGRSADQLFCKAWGKPGIVPQNLLFPTCLYHQIDKGFSPRELPHPSLFDRADEAPHKAEIDLVALGALLAERAQDIAYVCVELADNAAGGQAVSLRHLRELRRMLDAHGLALVIDATRVLENAQMLVRRDPECAGLEPWALARDLLAQAHVVIGSLAKDFGLDRGGLIASDDEALLKRVQALMLAEGGGLNVIDKKLVGLALSRRGQIESRVARRLDQVEAVWNTLAALEVPVSRPVGAHCVLIDVKALPEFQMLEEPVASFLAWLFLRTGIRAGAHSVGMQKNSSINGLVRLAVPQGLAEAQVQELCQRLHDAFTAPKWVPELRQAGEGHSSFGELHASYEALGFRGVTAAVHEPRAQAFPVAAAATTESAAPTPSNRSSSATAAPRTVIPSANAGALDIAVIGMAGRYPKARDLHQFWQNLREGLDCVGEFPPQRRALRAQSPFNREYRGGFLEEVDRFDSLFFNISPREAEMLDPQERLFLEVAWEALEDAGYYPELLAQDGRREVGVFVGAVWALYQVLGVEAKLAGNPLNPNSFLWSIANRVSYWMNLTGPSMTVDTACSSSLTAVYLACEALRRGDCSSALVGGVNLDLHQHKFDINNAGGALSADGVCRTFGAHANGYVAGEGVGAILLKPLQQALADQDQIYGLIRGVASNHGGRTSGYTVPNPKAQAELIRIALTRAGVDARSIGYVEAHGTGTELGDPIEISGLEQAFAEDGVAAGSCPIGSVKTNIGHLEAGAGLVGLTKVLLQMRARELVPSLHAAEPNPHIDFARTPFRVQQTLQPWEPCELDGQPQPLRAGVSSFGAGGANAHVIVEDYAWSPSADEVAGAEHLFPLSARSEDQLRQMARRLHQHLAREGVRPRLCDIAFTLQNGRKSFEHRAAVVASTYGGLLSCLDALAEGRSDPAVSSGNARNSEGLTRMLGREERERFIALLQESRDPPKLARLWIDGLLSDCRGLLAGGARRISLPTYPFADKRHWIAAPAAGVSALPYKGEGRALHPLIDSNESTFNTQLFRKRFHASEFILSDHVVSGHATLPGTAYLDLARRAGELATGQPVRRIRNITWVSPLTAAEAAPTDALIELKPAAEAVQFEVYSERADGSRQLYAQGKLEFAFEAHVAAPEYIDLAAIRGRCAKLMDGSEAYPLFSRFGLDYGPSFQLLREVYRGDQEVLGLLQLPAVREHDFEAFDLHPCVLDASMQAGVVGQLGQADGQMKVPYSISEVELLHPLTRTCYSHVTRTPGQRESSSGVSRENIAIVDEDGRVLVRIRESIGVPISSVHDKPAPRDADEGFEELYYRPVWESRGLPEFEPTSRSLLLFDHDDSRSAALRGLGLRVHCVAPGPSFEDLGADNYRIDPLSRQDYTRLFERLRAQGGVPAKLCLAWTQGEAPEDADALQSALDRGVYALLCLSQALIESKPDGRQQLLYLYAHPGQHDAPQPHNEAVDGFLRSLRLENPRIDAKCVELRGGAATLTPAQLLAELHEHAQLDPSVRYLGGSRQVRSLCRLSELELPPAAAPGLPLRQGGVYLITGGAGGLGLLFAQFLASQCPVRLVLSGRSALSAQREADLQRLREQGTEVLYVQADVADPQAVRELLERCQQAFGGLHGILHSAGVLRDSYLRNKSREDMAAVFAPKVFGGFHLDRCSADVALDFFVTFSSLAAIGGNAGQCDYAFANHYMDALMAERAALREQGLRSGRSLSLNWSLWADGGMRLDEQTELFFKRSLGIRPLRRQIGEQALLRALNSGEQQLAVLEAVPAKIEQAWGLHREPIPASAPNAPAAPVEASTAAPAATDSLVAPTIAELSRLVMEMLKLGEDELALDSILLDLGFDSIGLTSFANALNERYKLDLNPVLFFEFPTIRAIAAHLVSEHPAAIGRVHAGPGQAATAAAPVATATLPDTHASTPAPASVPAAGKHWSAPGLPGPVAAPQSSPDQPTNRFRDMPIAIVGMAGVMPQSDSLEEFWDHLANARNLVTEIPRDRWIWEEYDGNPIKQVNKSNSRWGGFMKEVDKFDPLFFGITPREAEMMDPQQRIFIETVWAAVEDSGHKLSDLSGTRTGVFVGVSAKDYIDVLAAHQSSLDGFSASGNSHSILANRVSFLLNLRGPSAPLDTACSSSLVALHRAIESIHTGSSDMAIVGGVQVMLTPIAHISLSSAGMLSIDGKCKTFDKDANGYVRGEGVGAIFIKPLHQAEADGNPIHAVIRSTAENHGGRVTMLTAPNPKAQAELLLEAYQSAEIDPATIGYIECHGTGTSLGDPIEIQALKKSFGDLYRLHGRPAPQQAHCGLSSVKTNIGHLEPAAGIAGLLKVLLSIRHQQIPALLHFQTLNPYIDLEGSPFFIADKTTPWPAPLSESGQPLPRCAGVSSFGWGGANAHVVLEEYLPAPRAPAAAQGPRLIVLSARNEERLRSYAARLLGAVRDSALPLDMDDLAYTLQLGRDPMEERLAMVVDSASALLEGLEAYVERGELLDGVHRGRVQRIRRNEQGLSTVEPAGTSAASAAELRDWFAAAQFDHIARTWAAGHDIDWASLRPISAQARRPRRLRLPTYPFARDAHWIDTSSKRSAAAAAERLHPLLHRNTSVLGEQRFSSNFGPGELLVVDHQHRLPAFAYLEMARAAIALALPQPGSGSRALRLQAEWPGAAGVLGAQIELVLRRDARNGQRVLFTIDGDDTDAELGPSRITHCRGQAEFEAAPAPPKLDLDQLKALLERGRVDPSTLETLLKTIGPVRGPALHCLHDVRRDEHHVLAELKLPPLQLADSDAYVLHPVILDGLLQAAVLLATGFAPVPGQSSLPSRLESLQQLGPCESRMFAWLRLARGSAPGDVETRVDADLLDSDGVLRVRLRGLHLRSERPQPSAAPADGDFARLLESLYRAERDVDDREQQLRLAFEKLLEQIL